MLDFLYTGDYDISAENAVTTLNLLVEIYSLADKYCIDTPMTPDDYISSIPAGYTPPATNGGLRQIVVEYVKTIQKTAMQKDNIRPQLLLVMSEVPDFGCDILENYVMAPISGDC
jgi:hypothetical protein